TAPFVDCAGIARSLGAAARGAGKPVLSQVITLERESEVARLFGESGIPVHEFTETAARTLAALTRRGKSPGPESPPSARKDVRRAEAAQIIGRHRESGRFLPPNEVQGLLEAYGIPSVPTRWISDRTDLEQVSRDMVYPLVLKAAAAAMIHKTDRGGVALDLRSREELLSSYEAMSGRLAGENPSFYVQEHKTGGREVFIGAKANEGLPPLILFGTGGVFIEALGDVQVRLAPLAPDEILDMIRSSRGYAVLEGLRGGKPADTDWLADVLGRLSQLAADFPEIDEIDLNPVLVFDRGVKGAVADARVKVKGSPAGG
ncbi:MAG: hypothetical protein FJY83_02025, partial [Candidatus Aminicenantes bacterium]|nr:hypothetical protein [Candidatus Aminicenantes bacterium]